MLYARLVTIQEIEVQNRHRKMVQNAQLSRMSDVALSGQFQQSS